MAPYSQQFYFYFEIAKTHNGSKVNYAFVTLEISEEIKSLNLHELALKGNIRNTYIFECG